MSEDSSDLTESFWLSLTRSTDLRDLGADAAEVALDAILDDGFVKDIPIIGGIYKLAKAGISIRDRLFAKRVLKFLVAMDKIPDSERVAQIQRLASDADERQRIGEQLILLLERLNDMRKPELLARAFCAYLENKIDRTQFQALAQVIDTINPEMLQAFRTSYLGGGFNDYVEPRPHVAHFIQCGLVTMRFHDIDTTAVVGDGRRKIVPSGAFRPTELAKLFFDHVLKGLD